MGYSRQMFLLLLLLLLLFCTLVSGQQMGICQAFVSPNSGDSFASSERSIKATSSCSGCSLDCPCPDIVSALSLCPNGGSIILLPGNFSGLNNTVLSFDGTSPYNLSSSSESNSSMGSVTLFPSGNETCVFSWSGDQNFFVSGISFINCIFAVASKPKLVIDRIQILGSNDFTLSPIDVDGSSIWISHSNFSGLSSRIALISARRSSIQISDSLFFQNKFMNGILEAEQSQVIISGVSFMDNSQQISSLLYYAIDLFNSSLEMSSSTILCQSSQHGGVQSLNSSVSITNSSFSGLFSGILHNSPSHPQLEAPNLFSLSIVFSNFTSCTTKGSGGALKVLSGNSSISDSVFDSNSARSGGAIYFLTDNKKSKLEALSRRDNFDLLLISNCSFFKNLAFYPLEPLLAQGGAISWFLTGRPNSSVVVENSRFSGNNAHSGAALFSSVSQISMAPLIRNCSFSSNSANHGGAISTLGSLTLERVEMKQNQANQGGALLAVYGVSSISDSIFLSNHAEQGAAISMGEFSYCFISHSLFWANNASILGGAISVNHNTASLTAISSNFSSNFASEKGGAISVSPPFQNIPSDLLASADDSLFLPISQPKDEDDQLGRFYVYEQLSDDRGKDPQSFVELATAAFFNYQQSNGDISNQEKGQLSIEQWSHLLQNQKFNDNDNDNDIQLMINVSHSIFTQNSAVLGGAMWLGSVGKGLISQSVFESNQASGVGGALYISNRFDPLINSTLFDSNSGLIGGAIHSDQDAKGLVVESLFIHNQVSGDGGAASLTGKSTTVFLNSVFLFNEAQEGGGAISFVGSCQANITSCLLNNNSAQSGGGVVARGKVLPQLNNCTITHNSARMYGGGVSIVGTAQPFLSYCNISFNHCPQDGGGAFVSENANPTFEYCTLSHNTGYHGGGILSEGDSSGTFYRTQIFHNIAKTRGGGMILNDKSKPKITECLFLHNHAVDGAGLGSTDDSTPIVKHSVFSYNRADLQGGGVLTADWSKPTFDSCFFSNNTALDGSGGGASIVDFSEPTFSNSTFDYNSATHGAGIYCVTTLMQAQIINCSITNNKAKNEGGGITISSLSRPLFSNCTITNNFASVMGGGISSTDRSSPSFRDCIVSRNVASRQGGGFYVASDPIINSCNISRNAAFEGGGMFINSNSRLFLSQSQFFDNNARIGGGIFLSSSNSNLSSLMIYNNGASYGAGITIEALVKHSVTDLTIFNNTASRYAGGVLVFSRIISNANPPSFESSNYDHRFPSPSLQSSSFLAASLERLGSAISSPVSSLDQFSLCFSQQEKESQSVDDKETTLQSSSADRLNSSASNERQQSSDAIIMENWKVINNSAILGGGFFFMKIPSAIQNRDLFVFRNTEIRGNEASQFGAAVFFSSPLNLTIFDSSSFQNNSARYAGSVATWMVVDPLIPIGEGFCKNCSFSESNVAGYQNSIGLATFPLNATFESDSSCPSHLLISNSSFDVSIYLQDYFGTKVVGPLLNDYDFNVSLSCEEASCHLECPTQPWTRILASSGLASFSSLLLQGKNNASCTLLFETAAALNSSLSPPLPFYASPSPSPSYPSPSPPSPSFSLYPSPHPPSSLSFSPPPSPSSFESLSSSLSFSPSPSPSLSLSNSVPPSSSTIISVAENKVQNMINGNLQKRVTFFELSKAMGQSLAVHNPTEQMSLTCNITLSGCPEGQIIVQNSSTIYDSCGIAATSFWTLSTALLFVVIILLLVIGSLLVRNARQQQKEMNNSDFIEADLSQMLLEMKKRPDAMLHAIFNDPKIPHILWNDLEVGEVIGYGASAIVRRGFLLKQPLSTVQKTNNPKRSRGASLNSSPFPSLSSSADPPLLISEQEQEEQISELNNNSGGSGSGSGSSSSSSHQVKNRKSKTSTSSLRAMAFKASPPFEKSKCEVALKQLMMKLDCIDPMTLRDFLIEIRLMSALSHDNIVPLIGVACSPTFDLYLVTEIMQRGSVKEIIERNGSSIPWSVRLNMAIDAAKGMCYLHRNKVIHRDLKTANILVNEDWVCKVADFGASTVKAGGTQTMTCVGTPAYMAPEVLAHTKYSEKADIYSFGVILAELWTCEKPYTGPEFEDIKNQAQLIVKIMTQGVKPFSKPLPPALLQLSLDCWNQDANLRPTFEEILVRLRRLHKLQDPIASFVPGQEEAKENISSMRNAIKSIMKSKSQASIKPLSNLPGNGGGKDPLPSNHPTKASSSSSVSFTSLAPSPSVVDPENARTNSLIIEVVEDEDFEKQPFLPSQSSGSVNAGESSKKESDSFWGKIAGYSFM